MTFGPIFCIEINLFFVIVGTLRRYLSGQKGRAVDALASAFGGSNPSRRTDLNSRRF
jgi:hypothetical protein